jgi:hypothetical protein
MKLVQKTLTDFSAGEISRKFDGRVDLDMYEKGCTELENVIVMHQGGVTFRPGTFYVNDVEDSSTKSRLIPFIAADDEPYILEFSDVKVRVYEPHARVTTLEYTTPFLEAELFDIKYVQVENVMYLTHPNHKPQELTFTDRLNWAIADGVYYETSPATIFASAGNYPRAVAFAGNRLWFAGTDNNPMTVWASAENVYDDFGVIGGAADAGDGLTMPLASRTLRTILWLEPTERGVIVGTTEGEGIITKVEGIGYSAVSPTPDFDWQSTFGCDTIQGRMFGDKVIFVQAGSTKVRDFFYTGDTSAFSSDDLTASADHITGDDGLIDWASMMVPYPSLWFVRNDGELAVFGYNDTLKVKAWSRFVTDGEFESIAIIPQGTEQEVWVVVKRTINGSDVRHIEYFNAFIEADQEDAHHVDSGSEFDYGTDDIVSLTANAVQTITSVTCANPGVVTCVGHGYSNADVVRIDNCDMAELNGREFTVANKTDDTFQLSGEDTSLYNGAEAATEGDVVQTPNIAVVMTTALAALGWSDTDSVRFEDIVGMTELNGRRFVIEDASGSGFNIDTGDTQDYTAYVSGGSAKKVVKALSGLTELEGETLRVWSDLGDLGDVTVASGAVTLADWANVIHVGLGFDVTIQTMRVEAGKFINKKRIPRVRMRFYETIGCEVGTDEDNLEEVIFRSAGTLFGDPPQIFTGDKEINIPNDYTSENYIIVKHTDPSPFTLLAIGADVLIGG